MDTVNVKTRFQHLKTLMTLLSKSDPYLAVASNYPRAFSPITIYPHQVDLLSRLMFVRPIRIFIGDEIGLGKTVESISLLRHLEKAGELKCVLIIVPRILAGQWETELMRMGVSKEDIFLFGSGKDIRRLKNIVSNKKYFVISIGLVRMEQHLKRLLGINWDTIVIDEAHNVTLNSVRTKHAIEKLVEDTTRNIIFLSATPHRGIANDYLFRLRLLDSYLVEEYAKLDINPFYESTHNSLLFRRTKEIVNNLQEEEVFKPCKFQLHLMQPTPEERAFTNALLAFLKEKAKELGEDGVNTPVGLLLVLLRKRVSSSPYAAIKTLRAIIKSFHKKQEEGKRQGVEVADFEEMLLGEDYAVDIETDFDDVAGGMIKAYSKALKPKDIEILTRILKLAEQVSKRDSKLEAAKELILDLVGRNEGKVLIFTEYRDTLDYLKRAIESDRDNRFRNFAIKFETLSGKDKYRFEEVKARFEDDPAVQVLMATDVASEGLNLQIANHMINYDAPWSPVKLEQRIGRIWRLGQRYISYVYNMFLSTDSDLAIVEKLYEKILNIEKAVGFAKPIIGEEVRVANLTASEEMWKTGEIGEIDYKGRKVRLTEHRLIYAELTDQIDEFVKAFLATIQSLNNELRTKNVFPIYSARSIRSNLKRTVGTDSLAEYEEILRDLITRIGYIEGKSEYEVNALKKHPIKMMEYLKVGARESLPKFLLITSEFEGGIFHIVEVKINGRKYFIGYNRNKGELLTGINLIKFVAKVSKNGLSAPNSSLGAEKFADLRINERSLIKNKIQRVLEDIFSPYRIYFRETKEYGIRADGQTVDVNVGEPKIISTVVLAKHREGKDETIDEYLKKKVETTAMEIAAAYEMSKDDVLKVDPEVYKSESYDILSYLKDGGKRYVEVKGHLGMKFYAELTENEYQTAEKLQDDYSLHLVLNLKANEYGEIDKNDAILLEFRNPLKSMQVKESGGPTRYLLLA